MYPLYRLTPLLDPLPGGTWLKYHKKYHMVLHRTYVSGYREFKKYHLGGILGISCLYRCKITKTMIFLKSLTAPWTSLPSHLGHTGFEAFWSFLHSQQVKHDWVLFFQFCDLRNMVSTWQSCDLRNMVSTWFMNIQCKYQNESILLLSITVKKGIN